MQGSKVFPHAQVKISGGGEKKTVGCSVVLKQRRVKRDGFEREGYGDQGKIVGGFAEVVYGAKGVGEILCADRWGLPSFHSRHKHVVVVNEGERSIGAHYDVVEPDVAMRK